MGFLSSIKSWLDAPFTTPLDTWQIFLVTGIVVISAILWTMFWNPVLAELEKSAREI